MCNGFYGKSIFFLSGPENLDRNQTAFNHLSFAVFIFFEWHQSMVVQNVTAQSVIYDLQKVSNMVREFFYPKKTRNKSAI